MRLLARVCAFITAYVLAGLFVFVMGYWLGMPVKPVLISSFGLVTALAILVWGVYYGWGRDERS